ncbi:MAG: ankyrin repeat domain-containing protein [Gammaproteobacteria bacterium]
MKRILIPALLSFAGLTFAAEPGDSALAIAAMERDFDTVRALLAERGADVNATGPYATPPLHWIVRVGEHELAQRLLELGADPNTANPYGLHPLHLAITNADVDMVNLLLAAGADPEQADNAAETPLMLAARSGSAAIVEALLEAGAAVDTREPHYDQTALMLAVRAGAPDSVRLLLASGADVDAQSRAGAVPDFRLPSQNAGSKGVGIVRGGWPERGERSPVGGAKTPLLYATRQGDLELTRLLVEAGADIELSDANGLTPLLNAILNASIESLERPRAQHIAIAHYLIERGANVNAMDWYGETPLWAAVVLRNLDVSGPAEDNGIDRAAALGLIETLLNEGADPNARTKEHPPEHRFITRLGDLSWVDFTGQTPFLRAALSGDVTTMKLLVEHGADPNIATFAGTTPLMAAAGINWVVSQTYDEGEEALLEAVKFAHALGNDVNAVNSMGLTAAHGAANRGSEAILRWLAEQGAKLDVADNEGRTPLTWAHGVFLATHPPVDRPETAALIEALLQERQNR